MLKEERTVDWRKNLRINARRTKMVIGLFILIYLALGFLVDLYINSGLAQSIPMQGYGAAQQVQIDLGGEIIKLLTFQVVPYATIIMGAIAILSIWITYALHNRLMLLGTQYREITAEGSHTLEDKQVYNVVEEMKVAAGLRFMPRVYIIEADFMNAFASGYSEKSAMVAVTRGLIQKLDRPELQAVMAHELSHIRHQDIKLTLMASVLSNLLLIMVDLLFYSVIFGRGQRRDNRLVFAILILRFVLPILTVVMILFLSRTREYMADAGAVELTRNNKPLAQALLKISGDYEQNSDAHRQAHVQTAHEDVRRAAYIFDPVGAGFRPVASIATLFSTHPPLDERLKALGFTSVSR